MAELHEDAFPGSRSRAERETFLQEIFFGHPWHDPSLPSHGYARADGKLVGFLGSMPRPMTLAGDPLQAVVTHNFVVDAEHRSGLAAIQLIREALRRAPTFAMAESNVPGRKIFTAVGGKVVRSRSGRWLRLLRPVATVSSLLRSRGAPAFVTAPLDALARLPDLAVRSVPMRGLRVETSREADEWLSAAELAELVNRLTARHRLRPVYDEVSMDWLFSMLRRTTKDQTLRAAAVRSDGDRVGWYVYYAREGGIGRVLQLGAARGCRPLVLRRLFADALSSGNVALSGATDPAWMETLRAHGCLFAEGSTWMVARTRGADLGRTLEGPDAYLGRMEGEGWLRFSA